MTPDEIPQPLVDILDRRAGKVHSRTGPVLTCLAEILTANETALASTLFDTVKALQRHVNERAVEIAEPRIAEAEARRESEVAELRRSLALEERRREDLLKELRRQIKAQETRAERYAGWLREHGISPLTGLREAQP